MLYNSHIGLNSHSSHISQSIQIGHNYHNGHNCQIVHKNHIGWSQLSQLSHCIGQNCHIGHNNDTGQIVTLLVTSHIFLQIQSFLKYLCCKTDADICADLEKRPKMAVH